MRALLALFVLCTGLGAASSPVRADEAITAFDAALVLEANGRLTVTETLHVRAQGAQIVHGIFRDFPTLRRKESGLVERHGFDVASVRRDGHDEPFHLASIAGGTRVYLGAADTRLAPGDHVYELRYSSSHQVRYFADFDELYWNVTGNAWAFPIEQTRVRISLPAGARVLRAASYSGRSGARTSAARIDPQADGLIAWRLDRALAPGEGLSVAVGFPKGLVAEPGALARVLRAVYDNAASCMLFATPLLLALYFGWAWWRVGRDPPAGLVIARFAPPAGLSPAALAHIYYRGRVPALRGASRAMIAALVSLAVRARLRIVEDGRTIELQRAREAVPDTGNGFAPQPALAPEELVLERALLGTRERLRIERANSAIIAGAQRALRRSLSAQIGSRYFRHNLLWWLPGAALAAGVLILVLRSDALSGYQQFNMLAVLIAASLGANALVRGMRRIAGDMPGSRGWLGYPQAALGVLALLAALTFGVLLGLVRAQWAEMLGADRAATAMAASTLLIALLLFAFLALLYAPSDEGRRIGDEIAGFRDYLSVAESSRLNMPERPVFDTALFERFLPYAIALGVEKPWAETLERHLASTGTSDSYRSAYLNTSGVSASRAAASAAGIASSLGASIASAMPASSGSGGGGSAGGGGGGGGGGGW